VIYDSKGDAVTVDDSDIMQAQEDLAVNEGIFVEPSSAVSLAAVKQLVKTGRLNRGDKIVAVLTSTGLKESESAAARLAEPPVIEPTIEALTETMKRFYHLVI
jgi:threonine synthase